MKPLLFFVMLSVAGISSAFQVQKHKPVMCYETREFIDHIKTKYDEKLQFSYPNGIYDAGTNIAMYSNQETGTWTLFEYNEEMACLLAIGKNNNL